jgi:hypothetical protein
MDPEIMGSLAAVSLVNGKPFNPDAQMKMMLGVPLANPSAPPGFARSFPVSASWSTSLRIHASLL